MDNPYIIMQSWQLVRWSLAGENHGIQVMAFRTVSSSQALLMSHILQNPARLEEVRIPKVLGAWSIHIIVLLK